MRHSPIKVITVEREYGSRGGEFAHHLARRLGWKLMDSELIAATAKAAGVSPELAAKFDEKLDPWYYRYGKVFWHDSAYPMTGLGEEHVFDSERMLKLIRKEIESRRSGRQLRSRRPWRRVRARVHPGLFPRLCLRHCQGQARLVRQGLSGKGSTSRTDAGRSGQAPRSRHSQVL